MARWDRCKTTQNRAASQPLPEPLLGSLLGYAQGGSDFGPRRPLVTSLPNGGVERSLCHLEGADLRGYGVESLLRGAVGVERKCHASRVVDGIWSVKGD